MAKTLLECRRSELPLDCLVCNAAVYLPTAKEPRFTADGFEISVGTNHLGHFLLANLLLEDLKKQKESASTTPRMVIVGSITGNSNTVAGVHIVRSNQLLSSPMMKYGACLKALLISALTALHLHRSPVDLHAVSARHF